MREKQNWLHAQYAALCVLLSLAVLFAYSQEAENNTSANILPTSFFVIPFEGEVELGLVNVLNRAFDEAQEANADVILLEMNTPGGRLDSALNIIDLFLNSPIPVYIYVKGDATSAGAIVSLAANKIFMEPMSTIGTAAPVMVGGQESETMQSKALSLVLAKVRTVCETKGFDETKTQLALAMIDRDMEIADPDNPEEMLTRAGVPLTLTASEAKRLGFIDAVVESREDIFQAVGTEEPTVTFREEKPSEMLARFLSSMAVSSLLLTIGFLGIFIEVRTPGLGVPGLIGALALALFFWGHAIANLAGWEGPLLFIIGFILISLEFFVIPGFGFIGIAGFICIFGSIVVTLLERPISDPHFFETLDTSNLYSAITVTAFTMLVGMIGAFTLPLLFPMVIKTEMGSWLLLNEVQERDKGYQSASEALADLVGRKGITKSTLRPAGIADIEGTRVDVVSQGGFINPQTPVEVVKVEGRRVVVRKV